MYTFGMKATEFSYIADDGKSIHVYRWAPELKPKACLLVAHGMAEHAARYARLAEKLTKAGYEVWAPDHRGHGKTAAEGELGWFADRAGFRRVIDDLHVLARRCKQELPGTKSFLMGHSMGSFLSQGFITLYGNEIDGCILSGTGLNRGALLGVARLIAALGCTFKGQKRPTPMMNSMSFGAFNKAFEPNRTAFDWLSRDPAEVDKYIKDPLCGFVVTFGLFRDLLAGFKWIDRPKSFATIPKNLPLYLFAGQKVPVGAATGAFALLQRSYQTAGIVDIETKLYPDGRHEMLNDTVRDEVSADIQSWLDRHL